MKLMYLYPNAKEERLNHTCERTKLRIQADSNCAVK